MQYFEYFWQNSFTQNQKLSLVVDFDTFIINFCQQIYKNTEIMLTDLQKQCIKCLIDPQNQGQVYKNGFLLFVRDFWSIPSNRTKLFNMKLNLKNMNFKQTLPMAGQIIIKIKNRQRLQQSNSKIIIEEFLIKNDQISVQSSTSDTRQIIKNKPLKSKGYITIGSSQSCDIPIDNNYINSQHIKLVYVTNLFQYRQSTPSFPIDPIPKNTVYIRDISKSNRIKQIIDNQNKLILLKKDMVIGSIGLINDLYTIKIDSLPESSEKQIKQIQISLNQDRISYIEGQPDKPIKKIINYKLQQISQGIVTDLYDRNCYYPQNSISKTKNNLKKQKQDVPPLKISIFNRRKCSTTYFNSKNKKKLIVGRSEQCDVVIDDISIRAKEFIFESIQDVWFLRHIQGAKVYMTANGQDCMQNSNRHNLMAQYINKFCISDTISLNIEIRPYDQQPAQKF